MARSDSIRGDRRRADLTIFDKLQAARHGRRDGRRGIPKLTDLTPAVTGYSEYLQHRALRGSSQLQIRLLRLGVKRVARIHALAESVVASHDADGRVSRGEGGRFREALAEWVEQVKLCGSRAAAMVDHANQQQQWYWIYVKRNYPSEQHPLPPADVAIDPLWEKPDVHLLFLSPNRGDDLATARLTWVVTRALELLADS